MADSLKLSIKEIIQRAPGVKSFRLSIAGQASFKAGQFLCASLPAENECKRYLSISSSPTEEGYIEFTKRITASEFSKALDKLKPGDSLNIQYPFGRFTLDDPAERIAFLSGGIGITPVRSICRYVVDKNLGTDIVLLYANRSLKDIIFKDDFEAMAKQYPKLKISHILEEPAAGFKCTAGLINAGIIRNEVLDYARRKFYVCGPPLMVKEMARILVEELIVPKDNIITEQFQGY